MGQMNWSGSHRFAGIKRCFDLLSQCIRTCVLRKKALRSKDERFRLAAASQLKDEAVLRQMALEAGQASVRKEAAALIEGPSFLTAIALNTWDIELGREVVSRIHNDLLLRRVAGSARQDAIRLAAAKKLPHPRLMKKIAFSSADVSLRWEVAQFLDDPDLMADVALFKPGHAHLDAFRQRAQAALLEYLNVLERQQNANGLLSFILVQDHLPFKLQALLRLPADAVQASLLQHISRQDFSYIEQRTIQHMLAKIQAAGWSWKDTLRPVACSHCKGKGTLALKTISTAQSRHESEVLGCPDCGGNGEAIRHIVTCADKGNRLVEFKLPVQKRFLINRHPGDYSNAGPATLNGDHCTAG